MGVVRTRWWPLTESDQNKLQQAKYPTFAVKPFHLISYINFARAPRYVIRTSTMHCLLDYTQYIEACLSGIQNQFKVWRKWRTWYQCGPPISLPITLGHFWSLLICLCPNWVYPVCTYMYANVGLNWNDTNMDWIWGQCQIMNGVWLTNLFQSDVADRHQTLDQTVEKCNPIYQNSVWSLVSPITLRLEVVVSTLMITLRNTNLLDAALMICTQPWYSPILRLVESAYIEVHLWFTSHS